MTGFTIDLNEAMPGGHRMQCANDRELSPHSSGVKSITQVTLTPGCCSRPSLVVLDLFAWLDAVMVGSIMVNQSLGRVGGVVTRTTPLDASPGMASGTLKSPLTLEEAIPRLKAYLSFRLCGRSCTTSCSRPTDIISRGLPGGGWLSTSGPVHRPCDYRRLDITSWV